MSVFSNVIGHEAIREHLHAAIVRKTVSHAYLFEGMAGVGKKTMAMEFIKALLCTEPQVDHMACGRCSSCITMESGNQPDVIWIGRGEKNTIGVKTIREQLVQDISIMPYQSTHKVYVITEAHTMTPEAQNALLKTLEEPPPYALIILLAESSTAFLPTVLSRVIQLRFQPLAEDLISEALIERRQLPRYHVSLIASLSQGSLGRALELASSEEFTAMREDLAQMMEGLHRRHESEIFRYAELFEKYKDRQESLFGLMLIWIRDLLIYQVSKDASKMMTQDRKDVLVALSREYEMDDILRMFSAVQKTQEAVRQGAQYAFAVDCMLIRLANLSMNEN